MKKIVFSFAVLLVTAISFAQTGVNTTDPKSTLDVNGSFATKITEVTNPASFALDATHQTVVFRGAGGSVVLPSASSCLGREYTLVNFASAVITTGSTLLDAGTGTTSVIPAMTVFKVKSNGTAWIQVGKTGGSAADGSETKVEAGTNLKISGTGTTATPYKVDTKFFYMPSISINTSAPGLGLSKDLYNLYKAQFMTPAISSAGAAGSIPYFSDASQLEYYITSYDATVFSNVSISSTGQLTYDIIGSASDCSFMNIVFVVK